MEVKSDSRDNVKSLSSLAGLLGRRARPDTYWISKVTGRSLKDVETVVESITNHAGTIVEHCDNINRTRRSYYAQFPAPIDLYAMVVLSRPRNMIESGVSSGVSSTFMLMGIQENRFGSLHSIDFPVSRIKARGGDPWALPRGMASGWAVPTEMKPGWDLRLGRSEDLLKPLLDEIGILDFYCHDSPVDEKHFEFEMNAIKNYLRAGSLVIADNTYRDIFDKTARALNARAYYRRQSSLGAFLMV